VNGKVLIIILWVYFQPNNLSSHVGTADNWFNTFNTSSVVKSTLVDWPTDLSFHSLRAELKAESNGVDVAIDYYYDDAFVVTQYGAGFVGKALWL